MDLVKTSTYSFIATVTRIINNLIIGKALAVYVGPSGIALIGQFTNFLGITSTLSTAAIQGGIVKYTAEHKDQPDELKKLFSTSIKLIILLSIICSIIILIFSKQLSSMLFNTADFTSILIIYSILIIFASLNIAIISILNGKHEIKRYILANIASSFFNLIFILTTVSIWGVYGAILALGINQSVIFFVSFFFLIRTKWYHIRLFTGPIDRTYLLKLGKFSAMAITTAVTIPVSQIVIRNYIISNLSIFDAGLWDGISRISGVYLMVITSTISVYYMPKLSSLKNKIELRQEIIKCYKFLMPITILMALSIYLFRDYIVLSLLTKEFLGMDKLFFFRLLGDVLKISSWLLANIMVAKAMARYFIITEICFTILYVIFTIVFFQFYGLVGVTISYALNYFLYLLLMIYLFRGVIFERDIS